MRIDRSNYEAWLLDRIEGRLTPGQERELDAFLIANPDLAEERGELHSVEKNTAVFPDKSVLKRAIPPTAAIDATNLDDYLVARMEGDLAPEKVAELERFLNEHPEAAKVARQMAAARVSTEPVSFSLKQTLARTYPPQGMPDRHRLDDFLVARLEGELNTDQERPLDELLKADMAAWRSWQLMQRTRIAAEMIHFADKSSLRKKEVKVIPLWSRTAVRYAAAASVALLMGMLWWMSRDIAPEEQFANDPPVKALPSRAAGENNMNEQAPVKQQDMKSAGSSATDHVGTEVKGTDNDVSRPVEPPRSTPGRLQRMDPMLAAHKERQEVLPVGAEVPQVPISHDAPVGTTLASQEGSMTVGELLASTVRTEVLDQGRQGPRALDGADAVALVDKGLEALGGDRAGLQVRHAGSRRRFSLRLGDGLALSASTSR